MRRTIGSMSWWCCCFALLLLPAAPACIQAGCVRNSDCASADWCIDTKCVPRPVDGGASLSSDGGADKDAASDSAAFDAAITHDAGKSTSTTKSSDAGDAGGTQDAAAAM